MAVHNLLRATEAGLGDGETPIFPVQIFKVKEGVNYNEGDPNYDLFRHALRCSAKRLFPNFSFVDAPFNLKYYKPGHHETEIAYMGCRTRVIGNVYDPTREVCNRRGNLSFTSINLPRIAYLAKDEKDFYAKLDHMMDVSARSLKIKRTVITKLMNEGLYPYTRRYLGTFDNHFSTIGLVGMNEACLNAKWLHEDLTHEAAQRFSRDVLNHMRERLSDYQEKYGDLYNLEATPAESTSYRLAKHDVALYPDIITANEHGTPYYTNSSHLPVGYTEDVFAALDVQDKLQTLYTSGTVFHTFLGEKLPDWRAAATLVRKIAENYRLPYYTMSPTYSICKNHGYLAGEHYTCPECGEKTEVYSRITGYYRPVQNWNNGKAQEFKDRKVYNIGASHLTHQGPLEPAPACAPAQMDPNEPDELLLFTTKTCPNCRMACMMLDKAGIPYQKIDAEADVALTRRHNVQQAPTLVYVHGGEATNIANASNIKAFIEEYTAQKA